MGGLEHRTLNVEHSTFFWEGPDPLRSGPGTWDDAVSPGQKEAMGGFEHRTLNIQPAPNTWRSWRLGEKNKHS